MSDKKDFPEGTKVRFTASGRYPIELKGTVDRYESASNGEWAIVKLDADSGKGERKTRVSTLHQA